MGVGTEDGVLLGEARALAGAFGQLPDGTRISERLVRSVIRPLQAAGAADRESIGAQPRGSVRGRRGSPEQRLVKLAEHVTRARLKPHAPAGLLEATAALQDLAVEL